MIKHIKKIIQVYIECIRHRNDVEFYIPTGIYHKGEYSVITSYFPYYHLGDKTYYKNGKEILHATLSSPEIITDWNGERKIKEMIELRELLFESRKK